MTPLHNLPGSPGPRDALDRTLALMRDHIRPSVDDAALTAALTGVRVLFIADRVNLRAANGQHALVAAVLLAARVGAQVFIDIPNVPLTGIQPPLIGD